MNKWELLMTEIKTHIQLINAIFIQNYMHASIWLWITKCDNTRLYIGRRRFGNGIEHASWLLGWCTLCRWVAAFQGFCGYLVNFFCCWRFYFLAIFQWQFCSVMNMTTWMNNKHKTWKRGRTFIYIISWSDFCDNG